MDHKEILFGSNYVNPNPYIIASNTLVKTDTIEPTDINFSFPNINFITDSYSEIKFSKNMLDTQIIYTTDKICEYGNRDPVQIKIQNNERIGNPSFDIEWN